MLSSPSFTAAWWVLQSSHKNSRISGAAIAKGGDGGFGGGGGGIGFAGSASDPSGSNGVNGEVPSFLSSIPGYRGPGYTTFGSGGQGFIAIRRVR